MPAVAPLTVGAIIKIVVMIIGVVIAICFLVDIGHKIYIYFANPTCKLHKFILMANKCNGTCPPGTPVCVATATRPYFRGWFGVQDSACACGLAGSGVAGGTGAPTSGGGSSVIKNVKKGLQPTDQHTKDTNDAIDDAGH